jgi:hypothetical protein
MSVTDDEKVLLDGLVLHAQRGTVSIIKAIKQDSGDEVALLCVVLGEDSTHAQTVPIAEIIVGRDIDSEYHIIAPDDPLEGGG